MKNFLTVRQLPEHYPAFSQSSIRWLIFNSEINGFNGCFHRIGRKIVIDCEKFEAWIGSQNSKNFNGGEK